MISWIQNRLIKNGKWIFSILLAVIIVAFVFVIGETPGLPSGTFGSREANFYGVNLLNGAELEARDRQTSLVTFMKVGDVPFSAENIRQLTYYRIATLHLADRYQIPVPDTAQLQQYILDMPRFRDANDQFDPDTYQNFLDQVRENPSFSGGLLDRAIQDEWRIDQIADLLAAQGFSIPYDVNLLGNMSETRWNLLVATRRYSSFQPELEFSEEELEAFYRNNSEDYQEPRKQMLSWIYFDPELYTDAVAEADQRTLLAYVDAHFYRYLNAAEDRDPETDQVLESDALLEKRRSEILADWKREQAKDVARRRAEDFATLLYQNNVRQNSDEFRNLLEALPNEKGEFNPVSRGTSPREAGEGATWAILQSARNLNAMQWFTDAVEFREGYGVIYLTGVEEPRIPELAEVRAEVERNFRESLRRREFNRTGAAIAEELRALVAEGHGFEEAVARSSIEPPQALLREMQRLWRNQLPVNSLSDREYFLQVNRFENVAQNSQPDRFPAAILPALRGKTPGEITEMITEGGRGHIVYIESMRTADPDESIEAFDLARDNLEFASSQMMVRNVFQELLERGAPREFGLPGMTR